jgi:hypothetical protein
MSGNGQRISTAPDWAAGAFCTSTVISRRFRCPTCGITKASDEPEMEPGFRLTAEAADALIRLAVDRSITEAAQIACTDKGTVSRLVKARYEERLAKVTRPPVTLVTEFNEKLFCVADATCGSPVAFFSKADEQRMVAWLSDPEPLVILTDAMCLPRAIHWNRDFIVSISTRFLKDLLKPSVHQSAMRMAAHLRIPKPLRGAAVDELLDEFTASSLPLDVRNEIFRVGAPARHFIRLRNSLDSIQFATSIAEGTRSIDGWLDGFDGIWAEIFAPTITILRTFRPFIFTHPACVSCSHGNSCLPGASAAVLTLRQSLA